MKNTITSIYYSTTRIVNSRIFKTPDSATQVTTNTTTSTTDAEKRFINFKHNNNE